MFSPDFINPDDTNHWDIDDPEDDLPLLYREPVREIDIELDALNDSQLVRVFGCRAEVFESLRLSCRPAWIALREYAIAVTVDRLRLRADRARAEWRWIALLGWFVVCVLMRWAPQQVDICVWGIAVIGAYATWQATARRPA